MKYTRKEDVYCLLKSLLEYYEITKEWTEEKYLSLTIKWDYVNRNLRVSMPGYAKSALLKFQHKIIKKSQDAPHRWNQPAYGAKNQYANTDMA